MVTVKFKTGEVRKVTTRHGKLLVHAQKATIVKEEAKESKPK